MVKSGSSPSHLTNYTKEMRQMDEKYTELCPFCETEVELDNEYKAQECPNCGNTTLPCGICMQPTCNNCPLEPNDDTFAMPTQ